MIEMSSSSGIFCSVRRAINVSRCEPPEPPLKSRPFSGVRGALPLGHWRFRSGRAPAANANTFATEAFVDELAHAAGRDPYQFRLALLAKAPRAAAVLKAAAEAAAWGKKMPAGHAQGLALCQWGGSVGALVADVSLDAQGRPVVHGTVMAVDCGLAINPDIVRMQVQGAVNYGLAMARSSKITIAKGRVEQSNFYDYTVLRNEEAPPTRVIVMPSSEKPTGIGELGTPPIAPAIANAMFVLNGKRVRSLPFFDTLA